MNDAPCASRSNQVVTNGADIQIENGGFSRIHNAILEQLALHDFTSREYACILYLLRMTYGFSRKECQLSNGDFAKATKLERTAIIKTLRSLVDRNVFVKLDGDPYHAATWTFNKYFEQWTPPTSVKTTTSLETSVETTTSQNDTTSSVKTTTTSSVETTTSYISAKERKEKKEREDTPAPVSVEQPDTYFGMPVTKRRVQVVADGYTQDAVKAGVDAPTFRGIVDALIDGAGWRKLVDDAEDDTSLNYAKRDALKLIRMGTKTIAQAQAVVAACKIANKWRDDDYMPKPHEVATYASQLGDRLSSVTAPSTNGTVNGFDYSALVGG